MLDVERLTAIYLRYPLPAVKEMLKKDKKDLTVWEHLKTIQSDGGKARWAKLTPEERSAQARKIVEARWAKKRAAEPPDPVDAQQGLINASQAEVLKQNTKLTTSTTVFRTSERKPLRSHSKSSMLDRDGMNSGRL